MDRILYDQGPEFDNQWLKGLGRKWHIKVGPITVKNPRANSICERSHFILGDMIRCQIASPLVLKHASDDPIQETLSAAAYGIRATVHGTTGHSPAQLVFNRDLILRTKIEADLDLVRRRRLTAIRKNNGREDKRRIKYRYKEGDQVLILAWRLDPKLKGHEGPYKVLNYDDSSGTLHTLRRNYVEPINIRNVRPYFGKK